jgi:hypothetical protein
MKMMKRLTSVVLALGLLAVAGTASAEEPFTANKPSVGGALKYGIYTGDGDLNPYGVGLGVNGGYTLDMGLFVGGAFDYYLGGSEDQELLGTKVEANVNVYDLMGVVGYDIGVSPELVVRPQLGVGIAWAKGEVCLGNDCQSDSESNFAIAPGAKILYSLGTAYLSGEVSYTKIFQDENPDAIVLGIGAGAAF